ncbi:MAG TPA: type II secretion system F family protein [Patescibacteria group bacterium]|nr:type II secretion system F family protein [Patescibacteria group bacterium]
MKFSYKAVKNGRTVSGIIEATDETRVNQYLKQENLLVVAIRPKGSTFLRFLLPLIERVSFSDVVNLTRQLAIMLNAGLTLINCLDILKKQITKPSLRKVITRIDDDIRSGTSFSNSLKKFGHLFSPLYISLIKAGEASGKLDEVLLRLSENLEKKRLLIGKIKGALVYPAVLIVGMFTVIFIMITFVVPKMLEIYENFDAELPPLTMILISISSFFQKFWPLVLIAIAILIVLGLNFVKTPQGKRLFDNLVFKIPIINNVLKISFLVDTTRTFSILVGSGVSILDTINIVKETSSNSIYRGAFANIYKKIEKGESLGRSFDEEGIFPPILVQMVAVGEESGHLDETLMRISTYFEAESEMAIKAMTTLIEPVILVILGFAVGFIVFAVITPIYDLTSSIQ